MLTSPQLLFIPTRKVVAGGGSLILDGSITASAAVAYSSRKLRTAYAGSAMKVRRSSDNATQDIGFSGNDLDTTALTTFVGANNGFIDTWYDQSGNGNNATTAAAGNQPQIVASGTVKTRNSKAAALWSNANVTYFSFTVSLSQPDTIALIGILDVVAAGIHFSDSQVGNRQLVGVAAGPVYQLYAGGSPATGGTPDTSIHSIVGVFNDPNSNLYVDGSNVIVNQTVGSNTMTTEIIGGGSGGPNCIDGSIPEYIVFTSALGSGDRATLRSSWQSYWGVP